MMSFSSDSGVRSAFGDIVLPHEITSVFNHCAKGLRLMVNLSSNWEVSVLKCQPGIRIITSTTYKENESITFIQCPNVTQKSSRFIVIGTYKDQQSPVNIFSAMDDSIITVNTFLSLVKGVCLFHSGELCYIYHQLRTPNVIRTSLSSLLKKYHDDP